MRTVIRSGAGMISKRDERTVQERQPWWLVVCWAVSGVGLNWYCAFEWFFGKYSPCSVHVLRVMSLSALLYGTVAFLVVRLVGARLRDTAAVFLVISLTISGVMLVHWAAHR